MTSSATPGPRLSSDPKPYERAKGARLFMDLGSHQGADSVFYLHDNYSVVAVEAHPALARHLELMELGAMRDNPKRYLRVVNKAITPTGDDAHLFVSSKGDHGETHSIYAHRCKRPEDVGYTVPGTTIPRLFKQFGIPFYLKVDIEGADIHAIRQLHDWAATPASKAVPFHVSVELCRDHPEEALEMMAHFGYMGYDSFQLVRQTHGKTVDIDALDYPLSLNQVATIWFSMPPLGKDEWYDLHARHADVTPQEA